MFATCSTGPLAPSWRACSKSFCAASGCFAVSADQPPRAAAVACALAPGRSVTAFCQSARASDDLPCVSSSSASTCAALPASLPGGCASTMPLQQRPPGRLLLRGEKRAGEQEFRVLLQHALAVVERVLERRDRVGELALVEEDGARCSSALPRNGPSVKRPTW